jgi:surface antigen
LAAPVLGLHRPPPRFVLESGAGSFSLDSPSIFVGRYAKVHFQVRIESVDARFECGLDARVWGVIAIRAREAGGRRQGLTNLLQPNSLRSQCRGFFAAAIPVRVPRVVSIMGSARQSGPSPGFEAALLRFQINKPSRRPFLRHVVLVFVAIGLATGCVTSERGGLSNQAIGTGGGALAGAAVGAAATRGSLAGILIGAVVGGLIGNLVGRALDKEEQRKLDEASQQAFRSETGQVTTFSVPSKTPGKEPTTVSAKAVGPPTTRATGATCRPIEQTATKNGQTLTETVSLCQDAGGGAGELKPTSI